MGHLCSTAATIETVKDKSETNGRAVSITSDLGTHWNGTTALTMVPSLSLCAWAA